MKALVTAPICPLMLRPGRQSERVDEVLLGMTVDILEETGTGWLPVRTHYGYTGCAPAEYLLPGEERSARWAAFPKAVVLRGVCDVLEGPAVQRPVAATLVRGCLVVPLDEPGGDGWQRVLLPDEREGYTRRSFLGPYHETPACAEEEALRAAIVASALSYLGTAYRWGGKTPAGMDCSGLTSMAYLLNGVLLWRDAHIKEGYPLHPIDPRALAPADLLFFPGHVALYLGEGSYLHATAKDGSDGVVINSLNPHAPNYRQDLAENITAVGSVFGK